MFKAPHIASKWDDTVASAANRETSPTAQVPKLFGRIYATASMGSSPPLLPRSERSCQAIAKAEA